MIDPQDIVGIAEAAQRAGVTGPALVKWSRRHESFPTPIRELKCGNLYLWSEVEVWLAERKAQERKRLEDKLAKLDRERAKIRSQLT